MSRIPVYDPASAPPESRATLERISSRLGRTLNIHGAMAVSPVLLDVYDGMERLLAQRSSLGEPVRQAIHLTVAEGNECGYCQASYTGAARATGFTLDETIAIRKGVVAGHDSLSALLAVARQIATNRGTVDQATWQEALDAGWTTEQVLEAYAEVVRTILTNYFNHLVEIEVDLRPAPPLS